MSITETLFSGIRDVQDVQAHEIQVLEKYLPALVTNTEQNRLHCHQIKNEMQIVQLQLDAILDVLEVMAGEDVGKRIAEMRATADQKRQEMEADVQRNIETR